MKHCDGDATKLQKSVLNIVEHYKGNHENCNQESRCRTQMDYIPTKTVVKSPAAATALTKAIMSTSIYKNAKDFATVSITTQSDTLTYSWEGKNCIPRDILPLYGLLYYQTGHMKHK